MDEKTIGMCIRCGAIVEKDKYGNYTCENCHSGVARMFIGECESNSGSSCILCNKFIPYGHGGIICNDCKALWKRIKEERSTVRSSNNE